MSATIETKYTEISVDLDDANGNDYFGYIAVRFNPDGARHGFFMECYNLAIMEGINRIFKDCKPTDISNDDGNILISLARFEDKIYAPDVVALVKRMESDFDKQMG